MSVFFLNVLACCLLFSFAVCPKLRRGGLGAQRAGRSHRGAGIRHRAGGREAADGGSGETGVELEKAVGQKRVPKMEAWEMEPMTKTGLFLVVEF